MFYSFRVMIFSVIHGLPTLGWAVVLMIFVLFTFANLFAHGIIVLMTAGQLTVENQAELVLYYGSLNRSMATLFRAVAGGKADCHLRNGYD